MDRSTLRLAALPLLLLALVMAFPVPALAADAQGDALVQQQNVQQRICDRLFNALRGAVLKIATRVSAAEDIELQVLRCEMDPRHRMLVDIDGELELKFPRASSRIQQKMEDLRGHQLTTDGPLNIDFSVTGVEQTAEASYHVEFHVSAILVLEAIIAKAVKAAVTVVGTVTMLGIAGDLSLMFEGLNTAAASDGLSTGMRQLSKVMMGLAGVEAYDAYRGFRPERESMATGESAAGAVIAHLGIAVAETVGRVALRVGGMTLGAAIGAALLPATGATLGAILGAAGAGIIGKVVLRKLTVDLPVKFRLAKIRHFVDRRAAGGSPMWIAFIEHKMERQIVKLLKRVSLEMRTDRFSTLDEIVDQVRKMDPADREKLDDLRNRIEQKLRFEAVEKHDELMARKLRQFQEAFKAGAAN